MPTRRLLPVLFFAAGAAAFAAAPKPIPVNSAISTRPGESAATRPLIQVTAADPPSAALLKDALAGLKDSREKLKSLHITGTLTYEAFDAAAAGWKDTGRVEGTAFAELTGRARIRLEIDIEHVPWTDGPAPFFDEKYVELWDGKETRHWQHIGRGRPDQARINPARALSADALLATEYAAPLMSAGASTNGVPVVHNISAAIRPATATARRVLLNNQQPAIELSFDDMNAGVTHETWYLDPDHGHALLAAHRTVAGISASSDIIIHALTEAAPGLFYPQHATRLVVLPTGLLRRSTFTASAIIANESFPDELFTLEFPPGMHVDHEP